MTAPTRGQRRALVLLAVLSVILVTLDARGDSFTGLRSAARSVFDPVQDGVTTLVAPVGRFFGGLGDLGDSTAASTSWRSRTRSSAASCGRAS